MDVDYRYRIDRRGRTASAERDDHVRDMIEQLLFTVPGERVNRPDFGCGLLQLVFEPNSIDLAAATQFSVAASLQQWLGDVITVEQVVVEPEESTLRVIVRYVLTRTQQQRVAEFTRGTAS
ncbi:MAG: GPW/gp25 family protein [Thermoanaerobaculia bacterium]